MPARSRIAVGVIIFVLIQIFGATFVPNVPWFIPLTIWIVFGVWLAREALLSRKPAKPSAAKPAPHTGH